ncbi:MAG: sugar phosphate isomerase/epimerase [Tannerellaceae bacterium]|jgi:sugar phosphate isomerase/epimerase|nr:sugar phosphate isomerase/epimerase [Tannerellaceae bacterium]
MNRRHFFKTSAAVVAASAWTAGGATADPVSAAHPAGKKKIGLQLYSLRDDMARDPEGTLREVAKMGYSFIETYGYRDGRFFGKTPKEFAGFASDLGMKMTSSHTSFPVFWNDTEENWNAAKRNMEDTREAGSKWIVQAGYPGGRYTSLDQVKRLAELYNRVGQLAGSFDLKLAYHNHREEFRAIEDQIPYQLYLELTEQSLMAFQMDIGHVANEMADYRMYLKLYPGRFGCLHIRDTNVATKVATEMGRGQVALEDVFNLFAHAGVEDYYVEQEEYNYTPLQSVKMCYDYLAAAPFVAW